MKPVQMWAVYNTAGDLIPGTVMYRRRDAIRELFSENVDRKEVPFKWMVKRDIGYTCRRVTVTPAEREGE